MNGSFGNNVCVEAVAEVDGINVVTADQQTLAMMFLCQPYPCSRKSCLSSTKVKTWQISSILRKRTYRMEETYHSKSLYMIVKKTCKNRFTALISTANKYSHASPDIMAVV